MVVARHQVIHENFVRFVTALVEKTPPRPANHRRFELDRRDALELFESQVASRHLDLEARAMKARNEGFYTIGSSGHEGNAAVAAALRPSDPCFLHYRSGAFMVQRSKQIGGVTPVFDTLLSLAASAEDPASGGRHKVWGSVPLWVPPQTSTIASHLPKAVGAAVAIERARALRLELPVPQDAIVLVSFGDASLNHSTAIGAINAALWTAHQHLRVPVLFLCEDNSVGISVRTPERWIESQYARRENLVYVAADGLDLEDAHDGARRAVEICRTQRRPTFLHLRTVRLGGHAGSDVEMSYRSTAEIEAAEARDPLLASAAIIVARGWADPGELLDLYQETEERVRAAAREAVRRPKLATAAQAMAPLAPYDRETVLAEARRPAPPHERARMFGGPSELPEAAPKKRHMAMLVNWALHDLLAKYPEMILFGEDVAKKGGVYHVTTKLSEHAGLARVFNTLLDEQTILGLAIGAAQLGFLPCPEIQYLAYLVHAADQLRGEACSLQFFSNDGFRNPLVVRVAGLAYQLGFGGHFHNDNGFAFLREIPGLVVAAPARGDDAVTMLRTSFALAKACGRVVVFLEPIALYMTKDLHQKGDELWTALYPPEGECAEPGAPRVYADGERHDLTIITYANGVLMSLRAARRLEGEGIRARVVDLRWLAPLNRAAIVAEAEATGRVLVVDEGRRSGGIGEQIVAALIEERARVRRIHRVAGKDCYVPLAAAADLVLLSEAEIEHGMRETMRDLE
jgi:2-oxoisovalerate dehydrogenase E1 component